MFNYNENGQNYKYPFYIITPSLKKSNLKHINHLLLAESRLLLKIIDVLIKQMYSLPELFLRHLA